MEKIIRRGMPQEQKHDLDMVAARIRHYLEAWHKQPGQRHSKTIIVFEGDRYRPTGFETHFRKGGSK